MIISIVKIMNACYNDRIAKIQQPKPKTPQSTRCYLRIIFLLVLGYKSCMARTLCLILFMTNIKVNHNNRLDNPCLFMFPTYAGNTPKNIK